MLACPFPRQSSTNGAALIIVLAFVVLLTGVALTYLSRTASERQLAHSSYNDTSADLLARTALDVIVSDFKQEIVNGSTAYAQNDGTTVYIPKDTGFGATANMVPQRSGNSSLVRNLIRRSIASDPMMFPGQPSRASAVSSAPVNAANPNRGDIPRARWNKHYLVPKLNTGDDGTEPIADFAAPDWVFVTDQGPTSIPAPSSSVVGRYAYAVYAEGGLLDMNVAGYPTNTTVTQSGRKGSLAYADLTALGNYPIPNGSGGSAYQVDKLVGWRNYATTRPSNIFPASNFASNFQTDPTRAAAYFTSVINNINGFLSLGTMTWNNRTDQVFLQRQELLAYRATTGFSSNALEYLGTFSRETNAPSFSPSTPQNSTIDYAALATTATAINPNFLLRRVTNVPANYKRFDGTAPIVGEPLVKTRFPLSRLAWITYKGPSAAVYALNNNDPLIAGLLNTGVRLSTIQAGTAANVKACFGLCFGPTCAGTVGDPSNPWTYTNPTGIGAANRILRLDEVAAAGREPDFFELLQAGILSGSLGESTAPPPGTAGGGTTGGNVFPDVHMSSTMQHLLTIGACIIDQADADSIPTRIQFTGTNGNAWTAYGVENLPYITQMYPIAGQSYDDPTKWSTYLIFQLWNPQANPSILPVSIRLRVDGGVGIFAGGNGETWSTGSTDFFNATGQYVTLNFGSSFSAPAPLSNQNTTATNSATPGTFGTLNAPAIPTPAPTPSPTPTATPSPTPTATPSASPNLFVGFRLPDFPANPTPAPTAATHDMQLWLQVGATQVGTAHPFNATLEVNAADPIAPVWVPYNRFVGIDDTLSWITNAPLLVRELPDSSPAPSPYPSPPAFSDAQLAAEAPAPAVYMKADPRSTRFGIFQMDTNPTEVSRIVDSLWPSGSSLLPNGYGGNVVDPGGPVEHAPNRFSGAAYYPATLCMNSSTTDARDTATTAYADNDGVIRPGDAFYPGVASHTGESTPYYTTTYRPIILNRPFRNVAELGYTFRDMPWKTLDFFTDKSADAGLLDIFCIQDGPQSTTSYNGTDVGNVVPTAVAGNLNVNSVYTDPNNSALAPVGQPILAGGIWDEIASPPSTVAATGSGARTAQTMMSNVAAATSAAPMQNKSELITRANLPTTILPAASNDDQSVKARREVVARALSSVSQTRVWNLLIDVIGQTGHFKPNATSLQNDFVIEGEEHYWVHVAIDRFTGQVIGKQTEVVKE